MEAYFINDDKFIDYYKILGVSVTSTQEEIQKKFRESMKKYHPDEYLKTEITLQEYKEINKKARDLSEAYSILSNKAKRTDYNIKYYVHYLNSHKKKTTNTSTNISNKGTRKKDSFIQVIKNDWKDIREKEKNMSFTKRHQRFDKRAHKIYGQVKDKNDKDLIFQIKRGTLHIFGELYYQLSKLSYIKTDSLPKLILRNRKTLAGVILASTCIFQSTNDKLVEESFVSNNQVLEEQANKEIYEKKLSLDYLYTIQGGDTLSDIAVKTGYSVDMLKRKNNLVDDHIYIGEQLKIPYIISNFDLADCTTTVQYDSSLSLHDFALLYNTTEESIKKLNEESITNVNGTNTILSDTLAVPTFTHSNNKTNTKRI